MTSKVRFFIVALFVIIAGCLGAFTGPRYPRINPTGITNDVKSQITAYVESANVGDSIRHMNVLSFTQVNHRQFAFVSYQKNSLPAYAVVCWNTDRPEDTIASSTETAGTQPNFPFDSLACATADGKYIVAGGAVHDSNITQMKLTFSDQFHVLVPVRDGYFFYAGPAEHGLPQVYGVGSNGRMVTHGQLALHMSHTSG